MPYPMLSGCGLNVICLTCSIWNSLSNTLSAANFDVTVTLNVAPGHGMSVTVLVAVVSSEVPFGAAIAVTGETKVPGSAFAPAYNTNAESVCPSGSVNDVGDMYDSDAPPAALAGNPAKSTSTGPVKFVRVTWTPIRK